MEENERQTNENPEKTLAERFQEVLFSEKHQTNSELAKKLDRDKNTIGNLKSQLKRKCIEEIKSHEDMNDEEKQAEINELDRLRPITGGKFDLAISYTLLPSQSIPLSNIPLSNQRFL